MVKKNCGLIIALVVTGGMFSPLAGAAPPQDYSLSYAVKTADGAVFRNVKYDLRDGNKFRVEYISGDAVTTIDILRKDKGVVWAVDPGLKQYAEIPMKQDAWDSSVSGMFATVPQDVKKTGTTKLLNYSCDIYERDQEGWTMISAIDPGTNVILRNETRQKGKVFQIMEATEVSFAKPAAALFEIPDGYNKYEPLQPRGR